VVSVKDLGPEDEAPPLRPIQPLDLAKLARPTGPESRIQPNDLIEVSCSDLFEESKTETFPARVEEDGTICLPLLSRRVPVSTSTCGDAEQRIRTAYSTANLIRQPHVTIRVVQHHSNNIYVIGAVRNPGIYELQPDDSDPLRAILVAGGLTEEAGSVVEIRRAARPALPGQPKSPPGPAYPRVAARPETQPASLSPYPIIPLGIAPKAPEPRAKAIPDAESLSLESEEGEADPLITDSLTGENGDMIITASVTVPVIAEPATAEPATAQPLPSKIDVPSEAETIRIDLADNAHLPSQDQLRLHNGDVVNVEQKKKHPFFVTGSVNKPGEFNTPTDREVHVLEAIGLAGGVNTLSEPKHARVIRRFEDKRSVIIRVNLRRAAKSPKENIRLMPGDVVSVDEDAASRARRAFREFIKLGLYVPLSIPF
jgi:protein involved in polysaccharide export with SLBB domain